MAKWILILIFSPVLASAEYRVFKLKITNSKTNKSRIEHSMLDWIQFRQFHYLDPNETIELVDTWMCWKRTTPFTPLCKRPVTADTLKAESEDAEGQNF